MVESPHFVLIRLAHFSVFIKFQSSRIKSASWVNLSIMDNLNHRELGEIILEIQKQEKELKRRMQRDDSGRVQRNGQLKFSGPPHSEHCLSTFRHLNFKVNYLMWW